MKKSHLLTSFSTLLIMLGGAAYAQDDASPTIERKKNNRQLEEVVVTARKQTENIQDISASLTSHTGAALDAMGVADIKDLMNVTPALTVTEMAAYSLIFIRGVGSDSFQGPIDSSVATYIDGLYITLTSNQAQSLGNVQSVTVLKGPQGTLYGRNAVGGAIVVETKKPSFEDVQANVTVEGGNYNLLKGKVHLSGPVGDNLALGVSGLYTNRETYMIYTPDPSQKHLDYDDRGVKVEARWAPTDWLEINASHYNIRHSSGDSAPLTNAEPSPLFSSVLTANPEPWETGVGTEVYTEMESQASKLEFDISNQYFNTKAIFGHSEATSGVYWDYDMAYEKLLIIEAIPNTAETDSIDIVFTSSDWGPSWLSWIGGIYVEDTYKDQTTPIYIDGLTLGQQLAGLNPNLLNNLVKSLGLSALGINGLPANPINLLLYGGVETDAKAAFAEFDIDITDYLSIKFGGRYSDETRVIPTSTVDVRVQNLPIVGTTDWVRAFDYDEDSATWTDFTPSFGIDFDLSEDAMVYYSYSTAFKSGNFNGLNINAPPSRIEPEEAESHEIGIKSDWLDGSLRLNAALFSTTVENGHAQILSLTSGGVTRLENAAEYTIDGAELEMTYNTPIDGLVVNFSGTWLDGAYDEYECTNFDPETGLEGTYDCSGNTTIRTADFAGVVDVSYRFDIGRFENELGLGAYYNSGFWFDPTNNVPEEEYTKVNARFSIRDSKTSMKLYGWGSNLTNEVSHMQRFRQDFGVGESYARPRMYGVGLEWEY